MIKTNLTKILVSRGYTHKSFAEKIGKDRTYITRLANGKHMPQVDTVIKILEALNVKFEEVWYREEKKSKEKK